MRTPQLADNLRRAVLQAAIEGKLSERLPGDGDARELLAQIHAEKQRKIAAGETKKEKPLPPVSADEIPFAIPENWVWVRLGEIGIWGSGATPNRSNPDFYRNGDINWLKTGDLNDGYIDETSEKITALAVEKSSVTLQPIGAVLIAMYGATIGKLGILNIPATTNQACCACVPFKGVLNKYLFYFLLFNRSNFILMGAGGAQPNISKEKIVSTLIPLPPLAEQQRIVEKLNRLLNEIDSLKAQEQALLATQNAFPKKLRAAILQAAIQGELNERTDENARDLLAAIQTEKTALQKTGKLKKDKPLAAISEEEIPFAIPDNWVWVRLGEIGETNIGLTYDKKDISDNGTIVLRSGNIQNDKIDLSDVVRISSDITQSKMCRKGDILICARNGSKSLVGKAAIINEEGFSFGAFMAVFRSSFNPYIFYYLHSPLFRSAFDGVGTTTINQITQDNLRNRLIPLPPLTEQQQIVTKLEALLAEIDILENAS